MAEMKMTVWNVEDGNSISLELSNGKLSIMLRLMEDDCLSACFEKG